MVNQDLVNYIQTYHSKGYSISTLKDFLITQGYNPLEVEAAINVSYKPESSKKSKSFMILSIIAGLVIIIALIFLISTYFKEDIAIIQFSVESDETSVEIGQPFLFNVELTNVGTREDYDVVLSYDVSKNGKVVDSFQETINSKNSILTYSTIVKEAGSFTINAVINYFEFQERSSFVFRVTSICGDGLCDDGELCDVDCAEIICGDGVCSDGEDCDDDCLEIICGDGVCDETENVNNCQEDCFKIICGNGICDDGETSTNCLKDCPIPQYECGNNICEATENTNNCPGDCKVETGINALSEYEITKYIPNKVAKDGASQAASECDTLVELKKKDTCFYWIMRSSNSSFYCKFIEVSGVKDDCYVSYSYETNDYSNCEIIVDGYKRETCELLSRSFSAR